MASFVENCHVFIHFLQLQYHQCIKKKWAKCYKLNYKMVLPRSIDHESHSKMGHKNRSNKYSFLPNFSFISIQMKKVQNWSYNFPAIADFLHADGRGSIHGRLLAQDRYYSYLRRNNNKPPILWRTALRFIEQYEI